MPTFLARLLALTLGLVLSAGLVVAVEPDLLPMLRDLRALEGFPHAWEPQARDARVRAELGEAGLPDWAGVYRTPAPWPTTLRLAPREGYTIHRGSWCGNCTSWNGGRVRSAGESWVDVVQVEGREPPPPDERVPGTFVLAERLWLVPWGEFVFAVPDWRMESFCADANDGRTFPRLPFRHPDYPAEPEDPYREAQPVRPVGWPRVPPEFRHLLRPELAECALSEEVAWRDLDRECGHGTCSPQVEVVYATDAGVGARLVPGLRLWVERHGELFQGRVEDVEAGAARVVFRGDVRSGIALRDLAGLRASTRHPRLEAELVAPLGEPR